MMTSHVSVLRCQKFKFYPAVTQIQKMAPGGGYNFIQICTHMSSEATALLQHSSAEDVYAKYQKYYKGCVKLKGEIAEWKRLAKEMTNNFELLKKEYDKQTAEKDEMAAQIQVLTDERFEVQLQLNELVVARNKAALGKLELAEQLEAAQK